MPIMGTNIGTNIDITIGINIDRHGGPQEQALQVGRLCAAGERPSRQRQWYARMASWSTICERMSQNRLSRCRRPLKYHHFNHSLYRNIPRTFSGEICFLVWGLGVRKKGKKPFRGQGKRRVGVWLNPRACFERETHGWLLSRASKARCEALWFRCPPPAAPIQLHSRINERQFFLATGLKKKVRSKAVNNPKTKTRQRNSSSGKKITFLVPTSFGVVL